MPQPFVGSGAQPMTCLIFNADGEVWRRSERVALCLCRPGEKPMTGCRVRMYVRLVQDMYESSMTVVKCAVGVTGGFKVDGGLHQGSALSPLLLLW